MDKEANDEVGDVDLCLNEDLAQLDEECDEHAQITIMHELLTVFEPYADIDEDNAKVSKLSTLSATLKKELVSWKEFRMSNLNRLRAGSKVAEITHEHEVATCLRFFGWLKQVESVASPEMSVFREANIGAVVEKYARWLEGKNLAWSTVANYLSALINGAAFATAEMEMPPSALDELANLRCQADKLAREQSLYRKRSQAWMDWEDVRAKTPLSSPTSHSKSQASVSCCLCVVGRFLLPQTHTGAKDARGCGEGVQRGDAADEA